MSTYGASGSATYSVSFDTLDQLIASFPDNTANLIDAKDIRDMSLTLWERTSATASLNGNDLKYTSASSSTVKIGGQDKNTNFGSGKTIQQIFDTMFFPYVSPTFSFQLSYNLGTFSNKIYREFGSPTSSFYIKYDITQGSYDLLTSPTSIYFYGSNIKYNSVAASFYYMSTISTQSGLITIPSNQDTVISLTLNDAHSVFTSTASIIYQNKMYWGSLSTFSSISSANVLALTGSGVGSGSDLVGNSTMTLNGINGNGSYLIFAMPDSFGTPSFVINGMYSNIYSKQSLNFVNSYSYAASYSVWYSNTPQYSPIALFQIN